MIYCCKECAEYALEEVVNDFGTAPKLVPLEQSELLTKICEYCGKPAAYVVSN